MKKTNLEKNKTFFQKGVDKRNQMRYNIKVRKNVYVPLAQPDRVFGYEPKGRGFESLKARQKEAPIAKRWVLLFVLVFITQNPANFRTEICYNVRIVSKTSLGIIRTFGF